MRRFTLNQYTVRCVYLANGATLVGFTLRKGATAASGDYSLERSGGGVWSSSYAATISNCVLEANSSSLHAAGALRGTLSRCVLRGNRCFDGGGGAYAALLNNCLVHNNAANQGAGVFYAVLTNCTICSNSASYSGGGEYS